MVEVDFLDFTRICKRLAKRALGKAAGKPALDGPARWKHVVVHWYRLEDDYSYRETENRLHCFSGLREVLELDLSDVPDYSTLYKAFDRFNMRIRRTLLRVFAQQHSQSGHVALDSTFFERCAPRSTISNDRRETDERRYLPEMNPRSVCSSPCYHSL